MSDDPKVNLAVIEYHIESGIESALRRMEQLLENVKKTNGEERRQIFARLAEVEAVIYRFMELFPSLRAHSALRDRLDVVQEEWRTASPDIDDVDISGYSGSGKIFDGLSRSQKILLLLGAIMILLCAVVGFMVAIHWGFIGEAEGAAPSMIFVPFMAFAAGVIVSNHWGKHSLRIASNKTSVMYAIGFWLFMFFILIMMCLSSGASSDEPL